jgi:hypothetical protein
MQNISGFGTTIDLLAIQTFPLGFSIRHFADDVDPLTAELVEPSGFEMLYDGTLFPFSKAAPIKVGVSVLADSDDDINLKILMQTRSIKSNLLPIDDFISWSINYPDNSKILLSNGTILTGQLLTSISSSGRKKSNTYNFVFGVFAGAQSATEVVATIATNVLSLI